jgi:hypothetical protein
MFFGRPLAGDVRYYALGLSDAPPADCCPEIGPSTWHSVKNDAFSVLLPPGWVYEPDQGIDSFIGSYCGDGIELRFDYGWYSDPLNFNDGRLYAVHEETIGGLTAKIVLSRDPSGTTGIHFAKVSSIRPGGTAPPIDVKLTLYGQDLTADQQDIVMQIFRSIRFNQP